MEVRSGAAAEASAALGAEGYALGDQVGFASTAPSLELAAHEAAHVMQATSGVQRHGGEGVYEDHADAVAARVVRGESAADLLAAGPVAAPAVRRGKQSRRQRRLAARYAAGPALRMRADQIADEQGIPLQIARAAVVARFLPGTDAQVRALGEAMYDANVTNGEANQAISDDDGLPEMATARRAAVRAFRDLRAAVTAQSIRAALLARKQLRRAIAVVEERYTDYRNLPYEADAHEVGDAVGLAFDELG